MFKVHFQLFKEMNILFLNRSKRKHGGRLTKKIFTHPVEMVFQEG